MPELKKEFLDTGIAKIEFRHFPLDIAAFNASKVAQCKNDGNSDILESLYANQQKWVKGSSIQEANKNLQKFLKNEGFSIDFDSCVNNKEIEDFVLNDRIDGSKNFKVSSTPTIIINNKKFEKALTYKNLKKALEKEVELKYDLERNVNLVSFRRGKIDISFNEKLNKNFIKNLTEKLLIWTGERWIISLSQEIGQKTLYESRLENSKNEFLSAKNNKITKEVMGYFSDAEISRIEKMDKSDD